MGEIGNTPSRFMLQDKLGISTGMKGRLPRMQMRRLLHTCNLSCDSTNYAVILL